MIHLEHFPYLKVTSAAKEEREQNMHFDNGYRAGKEDGTKEGMNLLAKTSRELTDEEYNEFIKFMVDRNLVITYTTTYKDKFACGLMIRKERR